MSYDRRAAGQRLRALRQARNLRTRDLAAVLGVSAGAVSYYERGHRDLPLPYLVAAAAALGAPPLEIVPELVGDMPA